MPIYEYKCSACGMVRELLQRHRDPAPRCDRCSVDMKKTVSRSSFILKGGGWYKDGYGSQPPGGQ